MKSLAEEINDVHRRRFYESHQVCGHGQYVWFAKGDWYHTRSKIIREFGTACNQPPKPPEPIKA